MSSAVIPTSAALRRPFLFDADADPEVGLVSTPSQGPKKVHGGTVASGCPVEPSSTASRHHLVQSTLNDKKISSASVTRASQLTIRPTPEMAPSGIPELDALTGGLPRGCLTEICGPASSGRTSVLLAALAAATRRGEYCAVIDAADSLDPQSVVAAGVDLDRLLWVRCGEDTFPKSRSKENDRYNGRPILAASFSARVGTSFPTNPKTVRSREIPSRESEHRLEQVLRATDLLLESGGFGLIILDLADVPPHAARRIPMTTWFRFRRAVEHKPTILLAIEQQAIAGSCSSLLLKLEVLSTQYPIFSSNASSAQARRDTRPTHAQLLSGLEIDIKTIRSRLDRKPAHSIAFETKTAWVG